MTSKSLGVFGILRQAAQDEIADAARDVLPEGERIDGGAFRWSDLYCEP